MTRIATEAQKRTVRLQRVTRGEPAVTDAAPREPERRVHALPADAWHAWYERQTL